jgi:hypothetical protein
MPNAPQHGRHRALTEKANVLRAQGRLDEAAALLRFLIERNPQSAMRRGIA